MNESHACDGKERFLAYYQPRLSLSTAKIVGLEALIRWNHPQKGLIPAAEFILQAERIGLIRRIGEFMLKTVTTQLMRWREKNKQLIPVAINVASTELYDSDLKNALKDILDKTGLSPKLFELEITETGLIEDIRKVRATLSEIRKMGITVSIDDFGTGYSSLSYLSTLPGRLSENRQFVHRQRHREQKHGIHCRDHNQSGSFPAHASYRRRRIDSGTA